MNLQRQALMRAAKAGMIRRGLFLRNAQKLSQRTAIAAPPSNPSLRGDAFEVTHQNHPEIHARWNRRPPHGGRIKRLTEFFDPAIELGLGQEVVQLPVERVPGRLGQVGADNPHSLLFLSAFTQSHHDSYFVRGWNIYPDGRYFTTA